MRYSCQLFASCHGGWVYLVSKLGEQTTRSGVNCSKLLMSQLSPRIILCSCGDIPRRRLIRQRALVQMLPFRGKLLQPALKISMACEPRFPIYCTLHQSPSQLPRRVRDRNRPLTTHVPTLSASGADLQGTSNRAAETEENGHDLSDIFNS